MLKSYHGKLTGIYNEVPTWKEFWQTVLFVGVPFSFIFAIIFTIFF